MPAIGGGQTYTLEYLIKVTGGGAAGAQASRVGQGFDTTSKAVDKSTKSIDTQTKSLHRNQQQLTSHNRDAKALAFGIMGMVTASAEFVGMLSMWNDTQRSVTESQANLDKAIKEHGKNSTEAAKATRELAKDTRFANMTFRNLMLSMFDLVPFTFLTINALIKLVAAHRGVDAVEKASIATKRTLTASMVQQRFATLGLAAPLVSVDKAGKGLIVTENGLVAAKTRLATVSGILLRVLGPIAIALGAGALAAVAYQNNIGGLRTTFDQIGVAIGNAIPQLKGFLNMLKEVALAFPNLGKMWDALTGKKKSPLEAFMLTEEQEKGLEKAHEAIEEFHDSAQELFRDIAMADKGDRKDFFESLGITTGKTKYDDAKEGAKDFFKELEDGLKNLDNVQNQFRALEQFDIMSRFGLEVDDDTIKKIRFSMEDKLRDVFKGGDDIFDELADVVEENAEKSQPEFNAAIAQFVADHHGIVDALEEMGYADLAGYFDGLAAEAQAQLRQSLSKNLLTDESDEAEKWKDEWWDQQFAETDFEKKVDELVQAVVDGLNSADLKNAAQQFLAKVIDPIATGISVFAASIPDIVSMEINDPENWKRIQQPDILAHFMLPGANTQGKDPGFDAKVDAFAQATIGTLFNAGKWAKAAIAFFSDGAVAQGVLTQIWNEFAKAIGINNIQPIIDMAASLDASAKALLNGLFNAGKWHDSIKKYLSAGTVIQGVLTDLFNQISSAFVKAFATNPTITAINIGFDWIKGMFSGIFNAGKIHDAISQAIDFPTVATGILTDVWNQLSAKMNEVAQTSFVGKGIDVVKKFIESLFQTAHGEDADVSVGVHTIFVKADTTDAIKKFNELGSNFSQNSANIANNAKAAAQGIINEFSSMFEKAIKIFDKLAKHWSKVMNSFINNAKSAASGVNSALAKIKNIERTITFTVDVKGASKAKGFPGGGFDFHTGGIISAASGFPKEFTTHGPQLMLVGDNPGGMEDITVVPRNNPGPTVARINKKYGFGSMGELSVYFNLDGNGIINDRKFKQVIPLNVGKNRDNFGS